MDNWTKDERACTTLWATLKSLNQLNSNFNDSGKLRMLDLTFFNPTLSPDLLRLEAQVLADQIDHAFRNTRGATVRENMEPASVIQRMIGILIDKEKEILPLAQCIDTSYEFFKSN